MSTIFILNRRGKISAVNNTFDIAETIELYRCNNNILLGAFYAFYDNGYTRVDRYMGIINTFLPIPRLWATYTKCILHNQMSLGIIEFLISFKKYRIISYLCIRHMDMLHKCVRHFQDSYSSMRSYMQNSPVAAKYIIRFILALHINYKKELIYDGYVRDISNDMIVKDDIYCDCIKISAMYGGIINAGYIYTIFDRLAVIYCEYRHIFIKETHRAIRIIMDGSVRYRCRA